MIHTSSHQSRTEPLDAVRLPPTNQPLILNLFALSGAAALIYQVCWQRLLFTAFGVDIESITIIVSAFMLGLGVGALLGGVLADLYPQKILQLFTLFEFSIGVFGIFSPLIISWVGNHFIYAGPVATALANFCLLLFPTILMGATLPMLVIHMNKTFNHIGISIGRLYLSNTVGASLGSLLVGFVLFNYFTLSQTIYLAAAINFAIATLAALKLVTWAPA